MTTETPTAKDKPMNTDSPSLSRRIVEITDEDENIIVAFVPVDPKTPLNR